MTKDPLLAALEGAKKDAGHTQGLTTDELCHKLGLSRDTIRKRLHALDSEGKLAATRVQRPGLCGRVSNFILYRLVDDDKKKTS